MSVTKDDNSAIKIVEAQVSTKGKPDKGGNEAFINSAVVYIYPVHISLYCRQQDTNLLMQFWA